MRITIEQLMVATKLCPYAETLRDCRALKCPALTKDGCVYVANSQGEYMNNVMRDVSEALELLTKERDDLEYKLLGVMHSVDKRLEGDELEQDEVNRAATMREKTLQIIEGQQKEIARLEEALRGTLPSHYQACSEDEAMEIGRTYVKQEATLELLAEVRRRLPVDNNFHNREIATGYGLAISMVKKVLMDIEREKLQEASYETM